MQCYTVYSFSLCFYALRPPWLMKLLGRLSLPVKHLCPVATKLPFMTKDRRIPRWLTDDDSPVLALDLSKTLSLAVAALQPSACASFIAAVFCTICAVLHSMHLQLVLACIALHDCWVCWCISAAYQISACASSICSNVSINVDCYIVCSFVFSYEPWQNCRALWCSAVMYKASACAAMRCSMAPYTCAAQH